MNERVTAFLTYLEDERGVAANTVAAYRNDLSQFAEWLESDAIPLASVDRHRLAGYMLMLQERGYAAASVARKVAALRTFFHFLRRTGGISFDPTEGLGAPEVKKEPPRSISSDDVRTLFERAQHRDTPEAVRDVAMLRLLYATGMRVSELTTLDLSDVHHSDSAVRVVGRGGRERILPVDLATMRDLKRYVERARPFLARHDPSQTALFLNHRGQRLTRQGFWLIMKALVKDAGLPVVVTPHTLRHSFAAHRVREGVALPQLQRLLGHASISTTHIYAQAPAAAAHPPAPGRGTRQERRTTVGAGAR